MSGGGAGECFDAGLIAGGSGRRPAARAGRLLTGITAVSWVLTVRRYRAR